MKMLFSLFALLCGFSASAQLSFEITTIDVGAISEDDKPREYSFKYHNTTDKPVVIVAVETSCSCASPRFSKEPIMPSANGEVVVTFYPDGHPGALDRKLYLRTNSKSEPVVLALVGSVKLTADRFSQYPYTIDNLRLKQKSVSFGQIQQGKRSMVRIEVANQGRRTIRLSLIGAPKWLVFQTTPLAIAPDSVADLVFICDPRGLQSGKLEADVMLEGVAGPPSNRILKVSAQIR